MGITISDSVEINRPAGEVFAYLIDVSNDSKWQKGLAEAKFTSEGPVAVGATGVHRAKVMGMTIEVGWQLTEYEEFRRTGWKFMSGPFTGNESYTLEFAPGGTKFLHAAELRPKGLLRLLTPIAGGMFAKQSQKNLQNLKRILESDGREQSKP